MFSVGTGIGSNSFHYLGIGTLKLFGPESESFYCRNGVGLGIKFFLKRIRKSITGTVNMDVLIRWWKGRVGEI